MIIGPPGTGKTDVAVQIISQLYHNFPTQKILLVTHSNAALNDLFAKLMCKDIDRNHLLRLGAGEQSLRGASAAVISDDEQISRSGRVNWSLERRMELLGEVQRLAASLGCAGDVGYSCETAGYFYVEHIKSRIERFKNGGHAAFPFTAFFQQQQATSGKQLFTGEASHDEEVAAGCIRFIDKIFSDLASYRAFELLRTQGHRSDYLLTKQVSFVCAKSL
jgi:intron-binding protein aquarius